MVADSNRGFNKNYVLDKEKISGTGLAENRFQRLI